MFLYDTVTFMIYVHYISNNITHLLLSHFFFFDNVTADRTYESSLKAVMALAIPSSVISATVTTSEREHEREYNQGSDMTSSLIVYYYYH